MTQDIGEQNHQTSDVKPIEDDAETFPFSEEEHAELMEFLSGLHERQERARIKHWVAFTGLAIATGIAWWVVRHWPRDE
jgi:hypothetical protein